MFTNVNHAHSCTIICAPVKRCTVTRNVNGLNVKQPYGDYIQCTCVTYCTSTSSPGYLQLEVPDDTTILPSTYYDINDDFARLFNKSAGDIQRKIMPCEIVKANNKTYILADILPGVQNAPIFYIHELIDGHFKLPTAIRTKGQVMIRQRVAVDVNDRITQMQTRRQPLTANRFRAAANWTVYMVNSLRIQRNERLREAGCELDVFDGANFYEMVDGSRLPMVEFGPVLHVVRVHAPEGLNEDLLV